jgi:hypothetical protein
LIPAIQTPLDTDQQILFGLAGGKVLVEPLAKIEEMSRQDQPGGS